jgi:hypothetical protein
MNRLGSRGSIGTGVGCREGSDNVVGVVITQSWIRILEAGYGSGYGNNGATIVCCVNVKA